MGTEELNHARKIQVNDTGGDFRTVAGAWEGLTCSRSAAEGRFFDLHVEGRGDGRVVRRTKVFGSGPR